MESVTNITVIFYIFFYFKWHTVVFTLLHFLLVFFCSCSFLRYLVALEEGNIFILLEVGKVFASYSESRRQWNRFGYVKINKQSGKENNHPL